MTNAVSAAPRPPSDPPALRRHIAAIADLGRKALEGGALTELFDEACELVGRALAIEYVAVGEDTGDELLLRAQRGWPASTVVPMALPRNAPSQAAYTLDIREVVVLADAATETRFQVAHEVRDFGIVSGISVPVRGRDRPFGVLSAHSAERRDFSEDESVFLCLVANVLAAAVESSSAAEAAQAREELLGSLVEHGPDIVVRLDSELRHLFISPAVELATGRTPESFIGKTAGELGFADEPVARWDGELRTVFETGQPCRFEFQLDGRWFESHAVAEPDDVGGVASIVVFTRDRTDARNADARYRDLFELATDMICLFDANGCFVDVNPAVERALGYSRDELIGATYDIVVAPEELGRTAHRFQQKVGGSNATDMYESALLTKSGRLVPAQVSSRAIIRNGCVAGVLAIVRDISSQKAAQAALEESERLFRGAFDDAGVGMLLTTPSGEIVRVNPAFARMLGYEPSELAGKTIDETTDPEDVELTKAFIELLVAGAQHSHRSVKRYRTKDGETVWCQVGLSAVRAEDGTVPYLVAQVEDVTELRRVQQELRESQALHRVVVESARDLITVHDLDGTVRLISNSVEDILGYSRDELMVPGAIDALVHPEDRETAKAAFANAVADDAAMTQVRVLHKDGSWRLIEGKASAGLDADGEPAFFVTGSRDVTDRVWLEEQLRQSQKMEAIGKLAGGVAHDFNNLLTVINGYSDIALAQLPQEQVEGRRSIEEIRRAGERAAELTHQLLAFSRKQVLRPEAVDLNEVVEGYLAILERIVGVDIVLYTDLDCSLAPVHADPTQLGQVLLNLVVNARDAMPAGGELHIATAAGGAGATLTVTDTGEGMDAETQRRIFEPFFTTKEPGKGTGMGLSTVEGIVEQSGGSIEVESAPGRGATFRIQLQAAPESAGPIAPEPKLDAAGPTKATILLVEDEPLVRGIVEQMLLSLGHRVIATAGPTAALDIAASGRRFDLVITDVVMPEMNGHELMSRLATLRPGLRAVYISGYTGGAVEARGVLDAGDIFLQKPFTVDALGAKVRSALMARG